MKLKSLAALFAATLGGPALYAGSVTLFGSGCGGDFIDSTAAINPGLVQTASGTCVIGGGTTGSSVESGIAGAGYLGVSTFASHSGFGSGFGSGMQAGFNQDIVFSSSTNNPINISLNVLFTGFLTADPFTNFTVDLRSVLFGHLAGYNSSCNCGIGIPALDGQPHLITSQTISVNVNTPIPFDLTLEGGAGAGGNPNQILLDLLHTVTLNPGAVFNLPTGVTVNSVDLHIANNQWTDPRIPIAPTGVPEPATWSTTVAAGLALALRYRRTV